MVGFALSFISGIAALKFLPFFPVSLVLLCIAAAVFLRFKFRHQVKRALMLIVIFVSGFLYSAARQPDLPQLSLPDRDTWVSGVIDGVPEMSGDRLYFTIDDVSIEGGKVGGKVRLAVPGDLLKDGDAGYLFVPGGRISALAGLREPASFLNPGVYSHDLKKDGIIARGYVRQARLAGGGDGARDWIHRQRQRLGMIIDNSLPAEEAAFIRAIVPGLKRGVGPEIRDAFNSTGLAHLLSISGTHFGLLAVILFMLVRGLVNRLPVNALARMTLYITPTQTAILVALPVLLLYALISGASVPTVRSLIMVFIFMLALLIGRKGQWLNSLSIAAFIILLWQPDALFDLSFQFSFLAVLSIGYVLEKRGRDMQDSPAPAGIRAIPEKIKTGVLITVSAVLGTAPLAALYFKQFPLLAPLTNLIITPVVCFIILPLGLVTGFWALISGLHVMPAGGLTAEITHFTLKGVKLFSMVPYADLRVHNPSFALTALYYLSLLILLKNRPGEGNARRPAYYKWRFLPLVLVLCVYIIMPYLQDGRLRITFLDVGQGDASVVVLPDKRVMVIDGGRYEPDMGRMVVAPYLWSGGIRKVDYLVASHPHPDHFGGLMYIVDNFDIGEAWLNGRVTDEALKFLAKIEKHGIPARILQRGDVLEAGGYKVYVLHPYDGFCAAPPRGGPCNQNNDSLVLKIVSGGVSVLFTGDIEEEAEENLSLLGSRLESDIMKVPHHGGRTSGTAEFLGTVRPRTAVISVGRNNIYRHPHAETLERLGNAGVDIFRTDRDGAVTVTFGKGSYKTETYADSRLKEVLHPRDEIRNLRLLF